MESHTGASAEAGGKDADGYVSQAPGAPDVVIPQPSAGGSHLTAEISGRAVIENLKLLRQRISSSTKLCAVVKANCYGHGLGMLLDIISARADMLAVATVQEALEVRRLGFEGALLVFFPACACADGQERCDALEQLISKGVTLTVVTEADVEAIAAAAGRVETETDVHVKVDTGMGRSGILSGEAPSLVEHIRRLTGVKLTGLYTHFASADEADKTAALRQLEVFTEVVNACRGHAGLTLHAANSAATIDLPQTHWDMVRPGIAIYGYQPSDQMQTKLPFRPALRLTGRLMQVKDVAAGSSCGYGLTYTFERAGRVGLVPVGYADGYMRSLSNKATMRVRGRDVPIRGRVSMDQTIIDLTEVSEARVGDEVEIISPDPQAPHSVVNLAHLAGTIPYEITCRLGRRVHRMLVD
ncbi:MAG: alanine racemase [Phycisphaerae bacterium]|nr:alanine racemase [Phycisphaerae bacterium]